MRRLAGVLTAVLAFTMCLVSPGERVGAQGVSPTPEQLQIFQGLTPEQQQAILSQLGGGGAVESSSLGGGTLERRPTDQFGRTDQATRVQQEPPTAL